MIILASKSPVRSMLLRQAGVSFAAVSSDVDEAEIKNAAVDLPPSALAMKLAAAKARAVSQANRSEVIIGADQLLVVGGKIFNKPRSMADAAAQLRNLRNATHTLVSAVCVFQSGNLLWQHVDEAHLTMRDFTEPYLEAYLAAGGAGLLDSVGAYKLESTGIQLFSNIKGDYFTILGLPLLPLLAHLRELKCLPS
jgi:septum formation protein